MNKLSRTLTIGLMAGTTLLTLSGCSAISTAVKNHNMDVETKTSNSVFLHPDTLSQKTIYVSYRNTTDVEIPMKDDLTQSLKAYGWQVTDKANLAHTVLQVQVLQVGEVDDANSAWQQLGNGFGSAMVGSLAGVGAYYAGASVIGGIGIGSAVAGVSWLADQLVENVTYSMITDVQISTASKETIHENVESTLSASITSANVISTQNTSSNYRKHNTRVAAVANQMNLDLDDALPALIKQSANQITAIFKES